MKKLSAILNLLFLLASIVYLVFSMFDESFYVKDRLSSLSLVLFFIINLCGLSEAMED